MRPTSWEVVDDDILRFMDLHCQEMRRQLNSRGQLQFHYEEARLAALGQIYQMDLPPEEVTPNVFILYVGMLAYEEYYPGTPSSFVDRLDQEFSKARSTLSARDPTHRIAAEYAVFYKQRLKEAQRHTHEARMGHFQHSRAIDQACLPDVDASSTAASVGSSRQSEDLAKQMAQLAVSDHPPSLFGTPSTASASRPGAEYFQAKESPSVAHAVPQTTKAPNRVAMPIIATQKQQTQGTNLSRPPPKSQTVASSSAARSGPKQPPVAPSSPPVPVKEPSMFSSQQGPFMFMPPSKPKAVASSSAVKPGVKQPPVAPSKPPAPVKEPSMFSSQQGPVMFRPPSKPKAVASSSSVKPGVKQPPGPPSKPKAVASSSSVKPGVKQPPGPPSKPKAVLKAVSSVDVDGAFQMVFPPRTTPTRWSDEESDGADEAVPQQATKVHKGLSASRHAPPATAPPPKQMSFPILEQRKQLTSKHSQQKADQESVLQQTSLQNQFRQYKKPDFTLDRGERRKLWELVTSAPTRFPFELTLQSADWCYKHCLGDNLRIIREFKANSNVTGLEVYFEDGFTKLIVGPRKQIHHSFRQSTAQRMWDLWLMLSKWINEDPELTMSKGLDSQLKKAAEKRAIEACSLMNSTTPPSPTETQRQQFTQTVGAQDKAKASLQKRLNDIWAHLSRDSSQPVDATEAQTAMTQFLQKELSSNSVLTEVQITEEVELENQRWMWMHAEHKRQYDAAAKREQAKGKGKAGT